MKRAAEFLLARCGPATLAAHQRRGGILILAYHNVIPDDAPPLGDRSLHLHLASFRSQVDQLEETHEIVGLESVRGMTASSKRSRAVITFDDAYRGALSLALPELVRRKLPATMFVAPGLLGRAGCWWDRLAPADGSGLPPYVRTHVLEALRGDDAAAVEWARSKGMAFAPIPSHAGIGTIEELRVAAALPGVTLGAHTWSHCNLAQADGAAHESEFVRPLSWLREQFTKVLPWLAYPYGLSAPDSAGRARNAGYEGVLRVEGGWVSPAGASEFVLPRLAVPAGLSIDGFILRGSGLMRS